MRRSTPLFTLALGSLVVLSGGLHLELRRQVAANAALRAQLESLPHAPQPDEQERSATVRADAPRQPRPMALPPSAAGATPEMIASANAWSTRQSKQLANPAVAAAQMRLRLLEMEPWRENLVSALGVNDVQANRILEFWIAHELAADSPSAPLPDEGQLRKHIGDSTSARLEEFRASMPARVRVAELRSRLASGTAPLREEQIEPLVGIVRAEWETYRREVSEYSRGLDWSPVNQAKAQRLHEARIKQVNEVASERIRTAAAALLSPVQVAELDAMQRERRELEAAREAMSRAQAEASRGTAVAKSD